MKTVLIVEDAEMNVDILAQILEERYHVLVARNGAEGVMMAEESRPDLILMDMSLPVMDGWEATRRIKGDPALKHIPVVGLSAHAMSGDAEKAFEAGCNDYLIKPVTDTLLFEKLASYLDQP